MHEGLSGSCDDNAFRESATGNKYLEKNDLAMN